MFELVSRDLRRLLSVCVLGAQSAVTGTSLAETEIRLEAETKIRPIESLSITPSAQLRVGASPAQVDSLLPGLGVRYRVLPQLSLGTGYRLNYDRNQRGEFRIKQRIHLDAVGKLRLKAWSFKYRLRLQEQWRKTRKGETRHRPSLRNSVQAKWQVLPKWAPFATVEHFLALEKLASTQTRKWRAGAGVQWAVAGVELQASYRLEFPIAQEEEGVGAHIVTLGVAL